MKSTRFIPLTFVREGQHFIYYSNLYRRATPDEVERHPAKELCAGNPRSTIMAYNVGGVRKIPVSFVTVDIKVIVATDGGVL